MPLAKLLMCLRPNLPEFNTPLILIQPLHLLFLHAPQTSLNLSFHFILGSRLFLKLRSPSV